MKFLEYERHTRQFLRRIFLGALHCSTSTLSNKTWRSRRSTSPLTKHIVLVGHSRLSFQSTISTNSQKWHVMIHVDVLTLSKSSCKEAQHCTAYVAYGPHNHDIDMVAGDFNGASWRHRSGPDQQFDSTLEETFKNANRWTDVCGFVKPARSQSEWIIRKHGAFEINQRDLGLEPDVPPCSLDPSQPRQNTVGPACTRATPPRKRPFPSASDLDVLGPSRITTKEPELHVVNIAFVSHFFLAW